MNAPEKALAFLWIFYARFADFHIDFLCSFRLDSGARRARCPRVPTAIEEAKAASGTGPAVEKKERQCSTRSWWCWGWARSPSSWGTSPSAINCEVVMLFDFVLGGIVALAVLAYLVVALVRPERF
jgi:K+-transporting ATPase KdpF subunit